MLIPSYQLMNYNGPHRKTMVFRVFDHFILYQVSDGWYVGHYHTGIGCTVDGQAFTTFDKAKRYAELLSQTPINWQFSDWKQFDRSTALQYATGIAINVRLGIA